VVGHDRVDPIHDASQPGLVQGRELEKIPEHFGVRDIVTTEDPDRGLPTVRIGPLRAPDLVSGSARDRERGLPGDACVRQGAQERRQLAGSGERRGLPERDPDEAFHGEAALRAAPSELAEQHGQETRSDPLLRPAERPGRETLADPQQIDVSGVRELEIGAEEVERRVVEQLRGVVEGSGRTFDVQDQGRETTGGEGAGAGPDPQQGIGIGPFRGEAGPEPAEQGGFAHIGGAAEQLGREALQGRGIRWTSRLRVRDDRLENGATGFGLMTAWARTGLGMRAMPRSPWVNRRRFRPAANGVWP